MRVTKLVYIPGFREQNIRRTRHVSLIDPVWNQTMVYPSMSQEELKMSHLKISIWSTRPYEDPMGNSEWFIPQTDDLLRLDCDDRVNNSFIGEVTMFYFFQIFSNIK